MLARMVVSFYVLACDEMATCPGPASHAAPRNPDKKKRL